MVEDACRLWCKVEARDLWGAGWGMPYSRSFAGVGGRFEGVSEWRECWEVVGVIALRAGLIPLGRRNGGK